MLQRRVICYLPCLLRRNVFTNFLQARSINGLSQKGGISGVYASIRLVSVLQYRSNSKSVPILKFYNASPCLPWTCPGERILPEYRQYVQPVQCTHYHGDSAGSSTHAKCSVYVHVTSFTTYTSTY